MNESNIAGMSVRVIIAGLMVLLCCALAVFTKDMPVLEKLAYVAAGFLFGRSTSNNGGQNALPNTSTTVTSTVASTSTDPNATK